MFKPVPADKWPTFFDALRDGLTEAQAARKAGIHATTPYARSYRDEDFAKEFAAAKNYAGSAKGPLQSKCGTVEGQWVGPFFQASDRELWFPYGYLIEKYKEVVPPSKWYHWRTHSCADLDQDTNEGKIHCIFVPNPKGPGWVLVWCQADVDKIVERRMDITKRKADPGGRGQWLNDDIFQITCDDEERGLHKGELFCRDEWLAAHANVSDTVPGHWRRHSHSALDQRVNGGRLRKLRVPKRGQHKPGPGTMPVIVSSLSDWDTIIQTEQRQQGQAPAARAGATCNELAQCIGLAPAKRRGMVDLGTVLKRFRAERPQGAWQVQTWNRKANHAMHGWRYDAAAFVDWLAGRNVGELAASLRSASASSRTHRRVQKAVAFLQFVLTHGRYTPILFRRFLYDPPHGRTLPPFGDVRFTDIRRWGGNEGIRVWCLREAMKLLPIAWHHKGFQGSSYWRLTEPVIITAAPGPEANTASDQTGDGNGQGAASTLTADKTTDYISGKEACMLTGLAPSALSKLCRPGGPIRYCRRGRRLRVHAADLARYIAAREAEGQ
jgi:hypothetical protein